MILLQLFHAEVKLVCFAKQIEDCAVLCINKPENEYDLWTIKKPLNIAESYNNCDFYISEKRLLADEKYQGYQYYIIFIKVGVQKQSGNGLNMAHFYLSSVTCLHIVYGMEKFVVNLFWWLTFEYLVLYIIPCSMV